MKKIISLLLVLLVCVAVFAACGGEEGNAESGAAGGAEASDSAAQDTTYDVGEFTVTVPGGWMVIPVKDTFGSDPAANKTDSVRICKGASSEFDLYTKPYVELTFWGADTQGVMPPKSAYKVTTDLESFTTGAHTWTGYSAETSMGKKLAILWEDTGDLQYQVTLWTEADDGNISVDDADVQKILASFTAAAAE